MKPPSRLSFLSASEFLEIFCAFRVCCLSGRFGGGKTALGVALSAWLLASDRVQYVVSNVPMLYRTPATVPLYNSAILLDEAWQYLESRQDVLSYAAYLRKFNLYLILPSVFPIHRRLDFFRVQRIFNAFAVGLPAWVYRYDLNSGKISEKGYFAIWRPDALFGTYDTEFVPGDDDGISDALAATSVGRGFKKRNKYAPIEALAEHAQSLSNVQPSDKIGQLQYAVIQAQLEEAIQEVSDAAGDADQSSIELQALSKQLRKHTR